MAFLGVILVFEITQAEDEDLVTEFARESEEGFRSGFGFGFGVLRRFFVDGVGVVAEGDGFE